MVRPMRAAVRWMALLFLGCSGMQAGAEQIPSSPDLDEASATAPAPETSGSAPADPSGVLQEHLKGLGLTQEEIDVRVHELSPADVDALAANPEQNQVAGIPGFLFPATILALVLLGVVLLFLESGTVKKFQ